MSSGIFHSQCFLKFKNTTLFYHLRGWVSDIWRIGRGQKIKVIILPLLKVWYLDYHYSSSLRHWTVGPIGSWQAVIQRKDLAISSCISEKASLAFKLSTPCLSLYSISAHKFASSIPLLSHKSPYLGLPSSTVHKIILFLWLK